MNFAMRRQAWRAKPSVLALLVLIMATGLLLPSIASADGDDESQVTRRFALVVGANDGGRGRVTLRYAGSDAKAVAKVLADIGGVAPADELLLLDPSREQLLGALEQMHALVERGEAESGRTEFVFYYSGHSDDLGLLLSGQRLSYRDLRRSLDTLPADVRIAVLDSCSSGAMTRTKGGRRVPPFLLDHSTRVEGHAFLTSSSADEAAQESDRINGSFFTHFLVSGLRGAADASRDGRVTLNEAYQFAFNETLARTEVTRAGAQHAAYEIRLTGSGDLVLTDLSSTDASIVIPGPLNGRFYIRDEGGNLVAELSKPHDKPVELALDTGRYTVMREDAKAALSTATVTLAKGQHAELTDAEFFPVEREVAVARGDFPSVSNLRRPEPPDGLTWHPAKLAFVPGLSTAGFEGGSVRTFASLNIIAGYTHTVEGVELGGVGNILGGDLIGGQAGGVGNVVLGDVWGLQLGGTFNFAGGNVEGGQLAGVVNASMNDIAGVQVAGTVNVADEIDGLQLSVLNLSRRTWGAQIGVLNGSFDPSGLQLGVLNLASHSSGLQLGVVNVADTSDAPIGIINIVRDGLFHVEANTSEIHPLHLSLRYGGTWTYTTLTAGITPTETDQTLPWTAQLLLGVHVPLSDLVFTEFEVGSGATFEDAEQKGSLSTARILVGGELLPGLSVVGGPTWNVHISDDPSFNPAYYPSSYKRTFRSEDDLTLRQWPGFFVGVRGF